jgi:hypothetical protein
VNRRRRGLAIVVPALLAALELSHPTWSEGGVSQAVGAAGGWWLPLHLLLLIGYAALVWLLWVPGTVPRILLVSFVVCNTAFLGLDGIGIGLLAPADPGAADRLWNSSLVTLLANLTGAAWAASLLSVAASLLPGGASRSSGTALHTGGARSRAAGSRPVLLGLGLTWLTFVASGLPLAAPTVFSRLAAVATGAWVVYGRGTAALSFALLVFAAVLRQHVGAEAALGMLLVGIALVLRERSAPAVASRLVAG